MKKIVFITTCLYLVIAGIITGCNKDVNSVTDDDGSSVNNNPVDLENCLNYGAGDMSELLSYLTACHKVWKETNAQFSESSDVLDLPIIKFFIDKKLLEYTTEGNQYYTIDDLMGGKPYFNLFEYNGEVMMEYAYFSGSILHDTFRINIIDKGKMELVNITELTRVYLQVYTGNLPEDFDQPSGNGGNNGGGSGGGNNGGGSGGGNNGGGSAENCGCPANSYKWFFYVGDHNNGSKQVTQTTMEIESGFGAPFKTTLNKRSNAAQPSNTEGKSSTLHYICYPKDYEGYTVLVFWDKHANGATVRTDRIVEPKKNMCMYWDRGY